MIQKSIDDLLIELKERWELREDGYGGRAVKGLCAERDQLRTDLARLTDENEKLSLRANCVHEFRASLVPGDCLKGCGEVWTKQKHANQNCDELARLTAENTRLKSLLREALPFIPTCERHSKQIVECTACDIRLAAKIREAVGDQ